MHKSYSSMIIQNQTVLKAYIIKNPKKTNQTNKQAKNKPDLKPLMKPVCLHKGFQQKDCNVDSIKVTWKNWLEKKI